MYRDEEYERIVKRDMQNRINDLRAQLAISEQRVKELERERDEAIASLDFEGAKATAQHAQLVIDEKDARITELEAVVREAAQPLCTRQHIDRVQEIARAALKGEGGDRA